MAKFLNGPGVQSALVDIITNAERKLLIISPYLNIPVQTKNYLKSVDKKGVPTSIVYRSDSKITDADLAFFKDLKNFTLVHCDYLHSKCYLNDKEGLITSMNLFEYSQTHNWEMGIYFSKSADQELYNDVKKEIDHLNNHAKPHIVKGKILESPAATPQKTVQKTVQKAVFKPTTAPNKSTLLKILDVVTGEEGYCIRCGTGLKKFDLQKPFCDKCYASWARYKNQKYKEKYCHACGQKDAGSMISFEKPCCKHCFTKLYPK